MSKLTDKLTASITPTSQRKSPVSKTAPPAKSGKSAKTEKSKPLPAPDATRVQTAKSTPQKAAIEIKDTGRHAHAPHPRGVWPD